MAFFFFFFPLRCTELTSFVPFVLMLMMHRFGPFREREREPMKVTREWRKKRENFMAYFLVFRLFCFHVAFIHIKMRENWRITNGTGARRENLVFRLFLEKNFVNSIRIKLFS